MTQDDHVLESLPAYVLGSLDEDEARQVAEHLGGCHICRLELNAFQRIADHLPLAAPGVTPSAGLKPRLMERIQRLSPKRTPVPGWSLPRRLLPVGAAAGLLLIIVLAVSNLLMWQRAKGMEVLAGPLGMRAIALHNTDAAPEASGFVIVSADGLNGVLVVDELTPLNEAQEYQLWLVEGDQHTSVAIFNVDESGYRGVRVNAPKSLLLYSGVRITIEPVGGSTGPTGESVLAGSLFNP